MHYTLFIEIGETKLIFGYEDLIEALNTATSLIENFVGEENHQKIRVFIEMAKN